MIRKELPDGWLLVTHGEHARLAGLFAEAWGNAQFASPEPRADILFAVAAHDDGWAARDAAPFLTKAAIPEAFTKDLVGSYAAFEEIDLPAYLRVRGEATAAVAERNPFAAIVVSMHTVNLLTEQADLSTIRPDHRPLHADFVAAQRAFQLEMAARLNASQGALDRAFRFLQTCDNLSLIACAGYEQPRTLRHSHTDRAGQLHSFSCTPESPGVFKITPSPFREKELTFPFKARRLKQHTFASIDDYRATLAATPYETIAITLLVG
ncbi:hypothetical protein CMV30_17605 [Nibricoccus aquaticus]|uniref:DUF3891 domain-containing protein n=1 Tax=Nibricoccus aquaticus TaxID=2576891 RepID=A0A290QAR0_9BACT|nr:DUF3891 family protein [Nibricoccus aquaticus]ATC65614.1 hypothetical protein CMV30_17605 [Nibricoccus aquaticus]